MNVIGQLQTIMTAIREGCGGCPNSSSPSSCSPCCAKGSLVTVYNAVLAVGQPPRPIAAFDRATIAIGQHVPTCVI
ncbi:hypothetical protein K1T71_001954 [Dendrolimus kikuchii]|uniref:Uncharacterized protein n=1 Tax=Dendrolimus kikuchii TaxID=765133 RepID=A0ACC1DFI7_9NEOP|nr:hypothetical protein K1T71_001954 [Dendrolimus kikuchii]